MAHHRHREHPKIKHAVLVRVLSALIGLSFGFAAGLYFSHPVVEAVKAMKDPETVLPGGTGPLPPMGAPLAERIAAAGRMDEGALTGLLTAVQDDWMSTDRSLAVEPRAMLHLRILFSRWTDLKPLGALKAALGLRDRRLGDMALEAVASEWGLRDMLAASQNLSLIPGHESRQGAMTAMVRAGVQRSPAEGLAIASRMTQGSLPVLRRTTGAEWMRHDATHALKFLMGGDQGIDGSLPAGWALGQWLLEDPAGFTTWRKKEPAVANAAPLLRFPADVFSPARLTRLQGELQKEFGALDAGTAWLAQAGGAAAHALVLTLTPPAAAAESEMKAWRESAGGRPAADTPRGWLARVNHVRTVRGLALRMAEADPSAALKWLASLPADEEAALIAPLVARRWLTQSPARAPGLIFAGDLSQPVMKAAAAIGANSLVLSDPLKSLEGMEKLPLDAAAAEVVRTSALNQLAARNPSALLDWVAAHPGKSVPPGAVLAAVKVLAATDLPRALQWVRQSAPPGERAKFMAGVFANWIRSDRDAALDFLRAMPPGREQEAVIAVMLDADVEISQNDALFAANLLPDCFGYALRISSDEDRLAALRKVLQCMKQMNLSVESALNHRSLKPADRAALLKEP